MSKDADQKEDDQWADAKEKEDKQRADANEEENKQWADTKEEEGKQRDVASVVLSRWLTEMGSTQLLPFKAMINTHMCVSSTS